MRVLFASTHNVICGIAGYNGDMMISARKIHDCDIAVFPQGDPLSRSELLAVADRAGKYDMLIIQHEWSFIGRNRFEQYDHLRLFLRRLRRNKVPTALIMHSQFVPLTAKNSSSDYWKLRVARRLLLNEFNNSPLLRIVVHGRKFRQHLRDYTVKAAKIETIVFPLQTYPGYSPCRPCDSSAITVLMFGFISAYKGYETALDAMRLLPDKYRLVIAGSQHPRSLDDLTYENVLGFLRQGEWMTHRQVPSVGRQFTSREREAFAARVIMTGYLSSAQIAEQIVRADIVLAPYFPEGAPAGSAAVAWPISLGKPTVVSAIHTFEDYIKAKCVAPVTPGAPHHLAQTIKALAEDPSEMERLSVAALNFAKENSVEVLTAKIIATLGALKRIPKTSTVEQPGAMDSEPPAILVH